MPERSTGERLLTLSTAGLSERLETVCEAHTDLHRQLLDIDYRGFSCSDWEKTNHLECF